MDGESVPKKAVTIRDVARLASVSVTTASRALNGNELVNARTRDRILSVSEELGSPPVHLRHPGFASPKAAATSPRAACSVSFTYTPPRPRNPWSSFPAPAVTDAMSSSQRL